MLRHHRLPFIMKNSNNTASSSSSSSSSFINFFKYFSSGFIVSASAYYYYFYSHSSSLSFLKSRLHHYYQNNNHNNIAYAAVNIPISNGGDDNNNNNSWNNLGSAENDHKKKKPIKADDDGICSYFFVNKSLPNEVNNSNNNDDSSQIKEEINTPGKGGVTPLMIAAFLGDVNTCRKLLMPFGDNNNNENSDNNSSSIVAADPEVRSTTPKDPSLARRYFSGRFNLPEGFTALEVAVLGGNTECVKLISEFMSKEIAGGKEAERMARVAAERGGFNLEALMQALNQGRQLRKERLRRRRIQFPLEARIAEKIVGQKGAIQQVAAAVRRKENGWVSEESPLVMIMLGSSGVGKTATSKLIAEYINEGRQNDDVKDQQNSNNGEEDLSDQEIHDHAQSLPPPFNQIFMRQAQQQKMKQQQQKQRQQQQQQQKGNENPCFIRLDMSEYGEKHNVSRITGASPSYVGYGDGGDLVTKLEKCPSAVVLFDEIEKAHPDMLTVLLQLFDEGRLTNGSGKTVSCPDATFIMTSNLAQREIADEAVKLRMEARANEEETKIKMKSMMSSSSSSSTNNKNNNNIPLHHRKEEELLSRDFKRNVIHPILRRQFGRDEFIGRINEIVFYLPFTEQEQEQLTEKQMELWQERAKRKHNIELRFSHGITKEITKEYDLRYGARSLQFALDRDAISPIAKEHELGNVRPNTVVAMRTEDEKDLKAAIPDFSDLVNDDDANSNNYSTYCGNGFRIDIAELKPEKMILKPNKNDNKNKDSGSGLFSNWFNK